MLLKIIIFGLICATSLGQQTVLKICSRDSNTDQCSRLQRGNSQVQCQWVQDSIECAKRIRNGTADFGTFLPESALHISALDWSNQMIVIKELKHSTKTDQRIDYASVVIVRKDHQGGLSSLKDRKYCHPGLHYSKANKWTEYFLKYMERKVVTPECNIGKSSTEIEVASLSKFFGDSCRPGIWSHDTKEDAELKKKYPSLCKLCPASDCKYDENVVTNGPDKKHQLALKCLQSGGHVAYVSKQDAQTFFNKEGSATEFRYLCPNNTLETIADNDNPCVWLQQPWKMIISNRENALSIERKIDEWFASAKKNGLGWEGAVVEILGASNFEPHRTPVQQISQHMALYREIPIAENHCNTEINWCTTSAEEQEKCDIIRTGAITSGVQPVISCAAAKESTVTCLEQISKNNSDFMGIDSNYGYLARQIYNLTAALYFETEIEQYSSVVTVVHVDSNIKSFENLRGKKVCLPEFGATPSIAFINLGKERKFFNKNECRYGHLLHKFFGDSCAPGAQDWKHSLKQDDSQESLCALCLANSMRPYGSSAGRANKTNGYQPRTTIGTCAAHENNEYFGNRGALKCLQDVGDVAILELQSLKAHAEDIEVDESQFRILCRNGSLASRTGFDIDLSCALTTIVDGEIMVRRGTEKTTSIVHAIKAVDTYFQIGPDFKMYNIFNSERNLLFKDSTLGVSAVHEDNHGIAVKNYIELFRNLDSCVGNLASKFTINLLSTLIMTAIAIFLIH